MCLHVYGAKTRTPVITFGPNGKLHKVKDPSFKMYGDLVAKPGITKCPPRYVLEKISEFSKLHASNHY